MKLRTRLKIPAAGRERSRQSLVKPCGRVES